MHPQLWVRAAGSLFRKSVDQSLWLPEKRVFSSIVMLLGLKSSASSAHYRQVLGVTGLALGEPVVPQRIWISSVKLSEFLQTAY